MVTNIKIIGFDEERPPTMQARPCIDLIFQLDQEAPAEWCKVFGNVSGGQRYNIKIDPEVGLFLETWVKAPGDISGSVDTMKSLVAESNVAYDALLNSRKDVVVTTTGEVVITPEQQALNSLVAGISFD